MRRPGDFSVAEKRAQTRDAPFFFLRDEKKGRGNEGRASEDIFFGFRFRVDQSFKAHFAPKSVMERYGTSPHDSDISRRDRPRGASTPRETFGFCFKGTGRANMSVRRPTR